MPSLVMEITEEYSHSFVNRINNNLAFMSLILIALIWFFSKVRMVMKNVVSFSKRFSNYSLRTSFSSLSLSNEDDVLLHLSKVSLKKIKVPTECTFRLNATSQNHSSTIYSRFKMLRILLAVSIFSTANAHSYNDQGERIYVDSRGSTRHTCARRRDSGSASCPIGTTVSATLFFIVTKFDLSIFFCF